MMRRFKAIDWFVIGALVVFAFSAGQLYALIAVVVLLLYLILRYMSGAFKVKTRNEALEDSDNFLVHYDNEHDTVYKQEIDVDRDIDFRPVKGRFRYYSRFDLALGKADYEYRCEGTKILFRLLNEVNEGESEGFKRVWDVRDGVVLESDLRARDAEKRYRFRQIDEQIADLKKATQWQELQPSWFNGFKYFLIKRCLPPDEARRYLRQEVERLKMGNGKAIQAFAEYGLEPDPDPKSIGGWKKIEGREVREVEPFWAEVESGMYGITKMECGSYGMKMVADLQKLLGDTPNGSGG